jgi:hypothetical protein
MQEPTLPIIRIEEEKAELELFGYAGGLKG